MKAGLIDLSLPLRKPELDSVGQRDAELFRQGHYGTHLDRHTVDAVPLEYFKSRALLFYLGAFSAQRPVEKEDVPLDMVRQNDSVLFHTGAMLRNPYASRGYLAEHIEFSWDLITALLEKDIRFMGLDARGLRMNEEHRKADMLCEDSGTFVIENLTNTELLPVNTPFMLYAAWFDSGSSGLPCRVIAETSTPCDD